MSSQLTGPLGAKDKHHCPQLPETDGAQAHAASCLAQACHVGAAGDTHPQEVTEVHLTSAVSGGAHAPVSSGQGNGWPLSHAPALEGAPTETPSGDGSASYFRFPTPRQAQLPPAPWPHRAPPASSPSICRTLAPEGGNVKPRLPKS